MQKKIIQDCISCQTHNRELLYNNRAKEIAMLMRVKEWEELKRMALLFASQNLSERYERLTNKSALLGSCKQQTGLGNNRSEARSIMNYHHTIHNTEILDLMFLQVLMSIFTVTSLDLVQQTYAATKSVRSQLCSSKWKWQWVLKDSKLELESGVKIQDTIQMRWVRPLGTWFK